MSGLSDRAIIRQVILLWHEPFYLYDLYDKLADDYKIVKRQLIMNILEELCESGVVKYTEQDDGSWKFRSVCRLPAYN